MSMQTRRSFFKSLAVGSVALGSAKWLQADQVVAAAKPQVQRRSLGRIGVDVPILALGLGSVFTRAFNNSSEEAKPLLQKALDHGVTCWDTSRNYGASERMIAPMVEKNRGRLFLISKSAERGYDGFMRELETSLETLRTDYLDIFHMHNFRPADDLDEIEKGALVAARKMRDEKVIRNFGVTGHSGARLLVDAIKRFDPDAVLTVFPCNRPDRGRYEDELLPLARERNMGVFAMKLIRHARNADLQGADLVRYGLTLDGVHSAVVGADNHGIMDENIRMASDFVPLSREEMARMTDEAQTRLAGDIAPWERPGYQDGATAAA